MIVQFFVNLIDLNPAVTVTFVSRNSEWLDYITITEYAVSNGYGSYLIV